MPGRLDIIIFSAREIGHLSGGLSALHKGTTRYIKSVLGAEHSIWLTPTARPLDIRVPKCADAS